MELYQQYIQELQTALDQLPWVAIKHMVDVLHRARLANRQVFIVGNGGSASTASHMACDLGKNTAMPGWPRFRVMALTDNMATFSALANDYGYENVFAEQLRNFLRPRDVLIAISTSGNSENVLQAVKLANERDAVTIGWTGNEGGRLAPMVDISIAVRGRCIEQIEDIHLILEHMATVALLRAIRTDIAAAPEADDRFDPGAIVGDNGGGLANMNMAVAA